jgi:hypothetical protein
VSQALSVLTLILLMAAPAVAAESVYQPLNEADCPRVRSDEVGATFFCHGPDGTPFLVTEGDARMSVTFGGVGAGSSVPFQSFGSFNSLGDLIEWRREGGVSVATILRFHLDSGDGAEEGQVLVVSKVGTGQTPGCVAAYVDALANPEVNALAREAADKITPNVDCAIHMPFYYGVRGPSSGEPILPSQE